jgi:hypothetical protein
MPSFSIKALVMVTGLFASFLGVIVLAGRGHSDTAIVPLMIYAGLILYLAICRLRGDK